MGGKLLEINETAITFICEVRKQSTSSVHLSNISDEYVAFKVKTTSPKRFCVRPNSGIISPHSACDFTITMQGLRSAPSDVDCKDKFLIQSTVVNSETKEEEVTLELFSKSSGKYVEEKKLRVNLTSKQDSPAEEHKSSVSGKELPSEAKEPSKEAKEPSKEAKEPPKEAKEPSKEAKEPPKEAKELSKEAKIPSEEAKELSKEAKKPSTEAKELSKEAEEPSKEAKELSKEAKEPSKEVKELSKEAEESSKEAKELSNEAKEPSKEAEELSNEAKEPSKEASVKEENEVKTDENIPPTHTKIEDQMEVKADLTTEESKASGDPDENERNLSNDPKVSLVKVVKEDPERKLRLSKQLKDLKLRETTLESQLKEAKSTISNLTCQNKIITETKETLQVELDRRSKKGIPFVFVCIVALIGLISGYLSDP